MSDGSAFSGTLTASPSGTVTIAGKNLVLARALTAADNGPHQWSVAATQNGVTVSGSIPVQVTVISPPPPPFSPNGTIIYGGQPGSVSTSEGTWTFGPAQTANGDWPTLLNGTANGGAVQMQVANGSLCAYAQWSGHWYLRQNGAWSDVGSNYPNGTIISGGQSGSLITSEGAWTFGSTPNSSGDWPTLLNGTANGGGIRMQLAGNGSLYVYANWDSHWWLRQNATWVDAGANSPDQLVTYGGLTAILTTSEGTWTFSPTQGTNGDWPTLLNGTANGGAVWMQITNGILYAHSYAGGPWWARQNATWVYVGTTAPVQGAKPIPTAITLSPASVTIQDNAPAGTLVATANVTMSDGSQFTGTLTTSNTNLFAISGLNIVTARAFTSADDGTFSTVITASQSGQAFSLEFSI
jgi:hypothetical protein